MQLEPAERIRARARIPRRRHGRAVAGFLAVVAAPTALAAWYWYDIAADRYVSALRYAIRGGPGVEQGEGAAPSAFGASGLAQTLGDGFILEDYLRSEAALVDLEARLPIRAMLARDGADPLRRFDPDLPREALLDYWNAALELRFDMFTGITALEVHLYRPEDSHAVAEALVAMLRALVARLSERAQAEMLAYVDAEFEAADARLAGALDAIERFRRQTRTVSPTEEAALNSATIAQLTREMTDLRVQLRTLVDTVPNSPRIPRLAERLESLEAQIASTRARVGGGGASALPEHLTTFERLQNEYQVALDAYVTTLGLRQNARATATLGRAHLVVFVPPRVATTPTAPARTTEVLTVAGLVLGLWLIGRVLFASLRTP